MLYNSILASIKVDDILSKVSDLDIFRYYIGIECTVGQKFKSPLRKDLHPSFCIFYSNTAGKYMYKDFATNNSGDAINFVRKYLNLSNYRQALIHIYNDLKLGNFSKPLISKHIESAKIYKKPPTEIEIKRKPFNKKELEYWKQYYITQTLLKKYSINSVSHVWINNKLTWSSTINNPIFAYKVYNNFKLYRPLEHNKSKKWRGNCTSYDIMGYQQLPKHGKILIITKALKDVIVLSLLGFNAVAPQSESTSIPSIVLQDLKNKFSMIYVLYDNDYTGLTSSKLLCSNENFTQLILPNNKYMCKDISDYIKFYGLPESKQLLQNLIKSNNDRSTTPYP